MIRKHPGIWFTLFALESLFWMGYFYYDLDWAQEIKGSIMCFYSAMMFYGFIYFNMKWTDGLFKKQWERDHCKRSSIHVFLTGKK